MEMIHCPGCASGVHHASPACPVCGAPHAMIVVAAAQRNPFKLIAVCVAWAIGFWFVFLFLLGDRLGGSLLLASIGLSVALTVRGKLPGTTKPSSTL
jgi:hypothetical protein